MAKTVVGLYDDFDDARETIQDLTRAGYSREDISLVASDARGEYAKYMEEEGEGIGTGAATGAGIGAVLGGLGGLLVGLGALAIPGIGPVLAAGPLVSALAGAGIGAAAGGLLGALVDLGVPETEAGYYAEGVRRGGALVSIRTSDERASEAADIMNRHNPVDIEERSAYWRSNQWTGYNPKAETYTPEAIDMDRQRFEAWQTQGSPAMNREMDRTREISDKDHIDVVEEEMRVGKRSETQDRIRAQTYITEKPVEETVDLRKERIEVERRPVDRPASEHDLDAFKEETIEVSATSEEPVVEKRARVVEEVDIHKDVQNEQRTIRDTVRRKDVTIEHLDTDYERNMDEFNEFEPMYRQHYSTNFSNSGYDYDNYRVAYTYGYDLANSDRYADYDWQALEPEARANWERYNQDTAWDDFKEAVRQGWTSVKNKLT